MTTSGTTGGALDVAPARLREAATVLDSVSGSLAEGAPRLRLRPDAGQSTDEARSALSAVATAVAAVAEEVRSVAENARTSAADYTATDQAVSSTMQQRRGELVQ